VVSSTHIRSPPSNLVLFNNSYLMITITEVSVFPGGRPLPS
jgi:hypothetical protein